MHNNFIIAFNIQILLIFERSFCVDFTYLRQKNVLLNVSFMQVVICNVIHMHTQVQLLNVTVAYKYTRAIMYIRIHQKLHLLMTIGRESEPEQEWYLVRLYRAELCWWEENESKLYLGSFVLITVKRMWLSLDVTSLLELFITLLRRIILVNSWTVEWLYGVACMFHGLG